MRCLCAPMETYSHHNKLLSYTHIITFQAQEWGGSGHIISVYDRWCMSLRWQKECKSHTAACTLYEFCWNINKRVRSLTYSSGVCFQKDEPARLLQQIISGYINGKCGVMSDYDTLHLSKQSFTSPLQTSKSTPQVVTLGKLKIR